MSADVIHFTGGTKLDIPADRVLDGAKGEVVGCCVIGETEDGASYFATSYADMRTVLWQLEWAKRELLNIADEDTTR